MVLVTRYSFLKKRDPGEAFRTFAPLRAAGLSSELAWKKVRDKGFGLVTCADIGVVDVSGDLLLQGVALESCKLQLGEEEKSLVLAVLKKQRAFFTEVELNVWSVDFWEPGCSRRLDLLGDFGVRQNFGVLGRVWVELKLFSEARFDKEVKEWRDKLEVCLGQENQRDPTLQGVLLLAASVPRVPGARWGAPTLHGMLLAHGSSGWISLACGRKAAPGQVKGAKPPVAALLRKMEWHHVSKGKEVGLLNNFLDGLGLPCKRSGQKAATYNALLRQAGKPGRLVETKLKTKAGRPPWVAGKNTFRDLYKLV